MKLEGGYELTWERHLSEEDIKNREKRETWGYKTFEGRNLREEYYIKVQSIEKGITK
jgi:hypothetical protein